jgi:hypothetical protein
MVQEGLLLSPAIAPGPVVAGGHWWWKSRQQSWRAKPSAEAAAEEVGAAVLCG